jgi:hypothetical protein
LGTNFSYIQTLTNENSAYESYNGMSDGLIELKYSLLKNISIIPQYIMSLNKQTPLAGTYDGGYGLKLSASFLEDTKLPIFINYGAYKLNENVHGVIDQRNRQFASLGTIYRINNYFDLGLEYFHDQSENHSPKEIMSHLTFDNEKILVRSGFGYGLNDLKQNEYRFFISIGLNFSLSSEGKRRKSELQNEFLLREINSVQEEDKRKMLSKSSLKNEDESLNDHSVIPFYTVKEIKQMDDKKDEIKENKKIITEEDKKKIEQKYKRLKKAYKTLNYFVELEKENKISKEKALTEFSWGLRVINMRRDTLSKIKKNLNINDNEYDLMDEYDKKTDFEKYASSYIKENKKELKQIRKKLKNEESPKKIETTKVKKKDWKKLTPDEKELKKEQEKAWEISKTKTLLDLKKERQEKFKKIKKENKNNTPVKNQAVAISNNKNEKNNEENLVNKENVIENPKMESVPSVPSLIIKDENKKLELKKGNEIKVPELNSLIDDNLKGTTNVEFKKSEIMKNNLLDKINNKLRISIQSDQIKYLNFYEKYKNELNKIKKEKLKKEEDRVNKIIIKTFVKEKATKEEIKHENNQINLEKLKEISIKKVEKIENTEEAKDKFLQDFYDNSNYDDATIYEEGDIEESLGPRY